MWAIHHSAPRVKPGSLLRSGQMAHGREQNAPGLSSAPGARRAETLVRVVSYQLASLVDSRGLNERIVLALMQGNNGSGVMMSDIAHVLVTGGECGPEQKGCSMQAVDASLDVP